MGARVTLKAENLQVTGSFKARGGTNAIGQLSDAELSAGVVAASAGNHAQAVAFAARSAGSRALLVMPERASLAKVAAVRQYGGEVTFVDGGYDEAQAEAARLADERGMRVVHAFDQPEVVAGQASVGLEIARQAPATRVVVVPLGGGGLAGGIGLAVAASLPDARVVGVQAAGAPLHRLARGPSAYRSAFRQHDLRRHRGQAPRGRHAPDRGALRGRGVTVSDDEVAEEMVLLLERSKLVVEGAGAVAVAALMHGRVPAPEEGELRSPVRGERDASLLSECIRLGETVARRRVLLSMVVPDRPGGLSICSRSSPSTAGTSWTSSTCATAGRCTWGRPR